MWNGNVDVDAGVKVFSCSRCEFSRVFLKSKRSVDNYRLHILSEAGNQ
jgi:hypothetical protein